MKGSTYPLSRVQCDALVRLLSMGEGEVRGLVYPDGMTAATRRRLQLLGMVQARWRRLPTGEQARFTRLTPLGRIVAVGVVQLRREDACGSAGAVGGGAPDTADGGHQAC